VRQDGQPTFTELADWMDGRLDGAAASRIDRIVATGEGATAESTRWLRCFRARAREIPIEAPPPIVRQNLRRAFDRWADTRPVTGLIELAGRLVFDSRRALETAGVRTAGDPDDGVHLAFAADGVDVVVDVHQRADGHLLDLDGQVYVAAGRAPVFEAEARGAGWVTRTLDGDELGRFRLARIEPEEVGLRVTNGEIAVTAALDLRRPRP